MIDRIGLNDESRSRIYDALTLALDWGHGYVKVLLDDEENSFQPIMPVNIVALVFLN